MVIFILTFGSANIFAQIPAFPGAEGWGAVSVGGRGGRVIEVTNLDDAGPGSFRDAVNAAGARTIVFRTGGIIPLLSEVQVTNPYIYIAGQTAPGDGIVIKNFPLTVFTHDVTIRGLRIRLGNDYAALTADNGDCIDIESGSYNVIIDHCSLSWGSDEILDIFDPGVNSVTVQWCILSEGLNANVHPKGFHSTGLLIGNDASKTSVHHNLIAHCGSRTPLIISETDHEFINNLVYDWIYGCELLEEGAQLKCDFSGNYYKPHTYSPYPELPIHLDFDSTTILGTQLYMSNNYFSPNTPFITAAQLSAMGPGNAALFSTTSLLSVPSTVTQQTAFDAYNSVLACAGALLPQRDTTDNRVLQSVIDSTGGLIDCIGTAPIFLDSGNLIGATDSTIIYSMLGHPIQYSANSRKIVITSGTGVGQVRYGLEGTPIIIDSVNLVIEVKINTPWNTIPDSTSTYYFYAGCNTVISSYPSYATGTPPPDSDHDGMPDAWELANGLNPNDSTDHNGTGLDSTGYTNLEVYLNGLYLPCSAINSVSNFISTDDFKVSIYPNPFLFVTTIIANKNLQDATLTVYNVFGEETKAIKNISGREIKFYRDNLPGGIYFIRLMQGNTLITTGKLIITNFQ